METTPLPTVVSSRPFYLRVNKLAKTFLIMVFLLAWSLSLFLNAVLAQPEATIVSETCRNSITDGPIDINYPLRYLGMFTLTRVQSEHGVEGTVEHFAS